MEGNYKKWINRINSKQDVLTEDNVGSFMDLELPTKLTPTSGDTVLARDILTNKAVEIPIESLGGGGSGLTLGETSSTAYRGDRGKIAYDHSQTIGNPHGTTKNDIGLGNVDNTSDLNKPISTATQQALNNKLDKGTYTGNASDLKSLIDAKIIGSGTANYIPKFTASGAIGNSIIYDNGTSVGIGSTLHVVQNDTSTVAAIIKGGLFGALIQGGSAISNYALSVTNSSSSSLLYVRGDGNVGIGTASPTEKLEVNGNVKATQIKDQYGSLKSQRVITITGNITLSEIHNGAILHITNSCNIRIETGLDANFQCVVYAKGSIIVTFVNGGVTINSPSGLLLKTDKMASLFASASNTFNLLGELATS